MKNTDSQNKDSKKIFALIVLIATLMITETGATYAWFAISANANNNITGTTASAGINFQLSNSTNATSGIPSLTRPSTVESVNYTTKPMIPQYGYNASTNTNIIQKAITGVVPTIPSGKTAVAPCVDANGNVVCRVYSFTIRNISTAAVKIVGRIYFTSAPTNLRWALMSDASTVSVTGTAPDKNLRSPLTSANCTATTAKTPASTANNCWFEIGTDGNGLALNPGNNTTNAPAGSYKQYWIVFWINETGAVQTDSGTWYATIAFTSSNGTGITSTINS